MIADLQLQVQDLVKTADVANNQMADIEIVLLQTGETHKAQFGENIYSISEVLINIISEI